MIATFDKFLISDKLCDNIKLEYENKIKLIDIYKGRRQKYYHEYSEDSWIHELVNKLIHKNLGSEYKILERVTILKYDVGDYFIEHVDGPNNLKINKELPYHFYGGVELCNKSEFDGGDFYINGKNVDFKKGRLFTHGFNDKHGVKEIIRGTRWSIHFLIQSKSKTVFI